MPIDKNLVQEKLHLINDYLKRIEDMHFSEDEFMVNVDYQDMLTFRLQQAVELCIDIATHLISGLNLKKPETARSSFEVLQGNKIISIKVANQMMLAVSFRNIVVHGYEKFNFKEFFYDYKQDVGSLKNFVSEIIKFLS